MEVGVEAGQDGHEHEHRRRVLERRGVIEPTASPDPDRRRDLAMRWILGVSFIAGTLVLTATVADLPRQKQALYNYQRKSLVYRKSI